MDLEDIAGYSLRRKLGSGSAGTVWQVRDLASGRNAVLKRVPITDIPDQEKLREDLAILQRLRHPHIARLVEFRASGTEWLLISQYVVAGSLTALLARRGPLTPGELVTLLIPLAEALDHLHRSGLTHGSLTTTNILFDPDGRPILTDTALRTCQPTDDLLALAALTHQAGGDPAVFTQDLFTGTPLHDLPRRLLALAAPAPIDLAFLQETTNPTNPPDAVTSPPRPRATAKPPTTDDPLHLSRGPLNPPPDKPRLSQTPDATKPDPPAAPAKRLPKRQSRRRAVRRPKLTRRTPTPPPINPLNRLAPPESTPAPPFTPTPASSPSPASIPALTSTPAPVASAAMGTPVRFDRPRTRRHPWRRSHTPWGRLRRRKASSRRRRFPHPAYGVLAAAALAAVIVLVIGIATFRGLDTTTPAAATNQSTAAPESTRSTTPPQPTRPTTPSGPTRPTGSPTPARSPTTTAARTQATQWALTLQALDAQRAHAFWTLDLDVLDKIYVPGSSPWLADRALLSTYRKQNVRVQGLRIQIDHTTITHQTATTVTLKTTDHLTAGQAVDRSGTTTPLPPGTPTTRLITLTTTRTTPKWRIATITPA